MTRSTAREACLTQGQRIRRARLLAHMSMAEVGAELGVSKVAVWSWEHDQSSPRTDNRQALARLLDTPIDRLFDSENAPAPDLSSIVADCQQRIARAAGVDHAAVTINIVYGGPTTH
ncbi:helix-turn-helix transcriptional regulator [Altererythrobacter sp. TH136]|uniref:helix-turn-helix domain-containing protein n=1 Tax=Altererythrobacter sp. TH136 TaxID=2067415 RepID=UPI001164A345|nr:helix-turn-helix transcriptional regulator [Altererythrobacter sp. TH136]QDM39910.1 helix-turn-helix transcriptional regulator [Altererythrobacter sp. TH136]